jgi:hypothetical protein
LTTTKLDQGTRERLDWLVITSEEDLEEDELARLSQQRWRIVLRALQSLRMTEASDKLHPATRRMTALGYVENRDRGIGLVGYRGIEGRQSGQPVRQASFEAERRSPAFLTLL